MKEVGGVSLCFLLTAGGGKGGAEGKKGGSCRFKSYCAQRSGSGSQVKHTVSACQQANRKDVALMST